MWIVEWWLWSSEGGRDLRAAKLQVWLWRDELEKWSQPSECNSSTFPWICIEAVLPRVKKILSFCVFFFNSFCFLRVLLYYFITQTACECNSLSSGCVLGVAHAILVLHLVSRWSSVTSAKRCADDVFAAPSQAFFRMIWMSAHITRHHGCPAGSGTQLREFPSAPKRNCSGVILVTPEVGSVVFSTLRMGNRSREMQKDFPEVIQKSGVQFPKSG